MWFRARQLFVLVLLGCCAALGQPQSGVEPAIAEAVNLASSGNLQQAEQILLQLEKEHPGHWEVRYRLGVVLLRQQKTALAGERLEEAARLAPRSALVWLGAAQTRLQLGRRDEAIAAADRALVLAPREPGVARALEMFYSQAGEFAKAADQELRWAQASPQDRESPARAAELYLRAGNAGQTIQLAEKILERGDSAAVRNLLGQAYRLKGDSARAVEELQKAIALDSGNAAYYADLARLFIDHRTPQPAVVTLQQGLQRNADQPELLRLLGVAYYGTGDTGKALDAFLRVIELQPDSEVAYASLETLVPDAGTRLPEIVERLRVFAERKPSNPAAYFLQARALQAGSPDKAAEIRALIEKAIAVEPAFWPAHFELHKILLERGDTEAAARALEKTIELNPDYAAAHYSLAQVYAGLGDRERARHEREIHHTLATRQREASEQRRQDTPRLPYTITER
ncbi:MAG: tetratricopeptide repeat protein [Bryobacterales bacterium]